MFLVTERRQNKQKETKDHLFFQEEGVKIYILLYKEFSLALGLNSFYTKKIAGKRSAVTRGNAIYATSDYEWIFSSEIRRCVLGLTIFGLRHLAQTDLGADTWSHITLYRANFP